MADEITEWAAYERLPVLLRMALQRAAFEYDARWYYHRWREGFTVHRLINHIKDCDLQYAVAGHRYKVRNKERTQRSSYAVTGVRPLYA
jgi:hypothetical protein